MTSTIETRPARGTRTAAIGAVCVLLVVLALCSIFVGVSDLTPATLFDEQTRASGWALIKLSRAPRTVALILAGSSLAVAGLIMQLLTRNPFVEPSTAGTMEFAGLGILLTTLFVPDAPVIARMVIAGAAALIGTGIFLQLINRVPRTDVLIVPLIGLMLSGIVAALTTFIAYRTDLIQSVNAWLTGDFSAVLQGRYELLWITAGLTGLALLLADRLTVAGMGESVATNLGLNYHRTMALGLCVVSLISAAVVVTVGMLPFIGLVVPNIVSMIMGANARRSIPVVAATGAVLVLGCDLLARTLRAPYELPIGTILGVIGGVGFLMLLLRRRTRLG